MSIYWNLTVGRLNRLACTIEALDQGYERYDFVQVFKSVYSFCNEDLSSIYLDILKDRLYTCPAYSEERLSAQTVLYYILDALTRILAPVMSFTAEETLEFSPKRTSETGQAVCMFYLGLWLTSAGSLRILRKNLKCFWICAILS